MSVKDFALGLDVQVDALAEQVFCQFLIETSVYDYA